MIPRTPPRPESDAPPRDRLGVHRWANQFVSALDEKPGDEPRTTPHPPLHEALARLRVPAPLALLLDYDGTLFPIAKAPDLAVPDADLLALIRALAERPNTDVLMVSGRSRDTLDAWLGHLPIECWAEHGVWHKARGDTCWNMALNVPCCDWLAPTRAIMEDFAGATPGAFVEAKTSSIAWHYRQAARGLGRAQARELRLALSRMLVDSAAEIIEGKRVLEVRPGGATKAVVVQHLLSRDPAPAVIVAFGDDITDEEMFAALPGSAESIHVGPGASLAKHRLRSSAEVRAFLRALLA